MMVILIMYYSFNIDVLIILVIIYDVFVNEENDAKILMTLTSPNCPVAETLPVEVEQLCPFLAKLRPVHANDASIISKSLRILSCYIK